MKLAAKLLIISFSLVVVTSCIYPSNRSESQSRCYKITSDGSKSLIHIENHEYHDDSRDFPLAKYDNGKLWINLRDFGRILETINVDSNAVGVEIITTTPSNDTIHYQRLITPSYENADTDSEEGDNSLVDTTIHEKFKYTTSPPNER